MPDERATTKSPPAPTDRAETLVDLLDRLDGPGGAGSSGRPDRTGLRLLDRRERARFLPWREVHERAIRTAGRLAALGIEPGDRVALIHPTGEELFDALFGALLAGAAPVPLYPPVRLGRLDEYHRRTARMVEAAGARVVLADRRVRRLLGPMVERAQPELGCPVLDELPEASPGPLDRSRRPGRPGGDDLAMVQFSSGTTVDPKPVALSHRAILAQVRLLNGFWPDRETTIHSGVSWLPLYHDMGLIGCVFPALERIADLTLIGPEVFVARPAVWLRAISRYRATISPAPNFAYGLCVSKIRDRDLEGVDLSSWRVALNGAEAVSAGTLRAFTERFGRYGFRPEALTPVYGLSEAALAVTFSSLEQPFVSRRFERESLEPGAAVRPAGPAPDPATDRDGGSPPVARELVSVGTPLPDFAVQVREPSADGAAASARPLPDGRVGRVWVRGPSLMTGYLGRPEATRRALVDGWLDTGDLGFVWEGELYLTGRAKDVVIVRGRNVAPEEIEAAAARAPGARAGCAVAASWTPDLDPDPELPSDSEELAVFVERARDADASDLKGLAKA
ncbi:MAG: AMP-binding protein, partial [Acidobacteriota bacterium]